MHADYNLCDICKAPTSKELSLWLFQERRLDAAGSLDDFGETVDLCYKCSIRVLKMLLAQQKDAEVLGPKIWEIVKHLRRQVASNVDTDL